MLIVASMVLGVQNLFGEAKRLLKDVWTLKAEGVSKLSIAFLDVESYKDFTNLCGRLLMRHYFKPSKIWILLMSDSAHPPSSALWPCLQISQSEF